MMHLQNHSFIALSGFFMILLFFVLVLFIFEIIAKWYFFKKCGKKGWEAIIPFYSSWTLVEIAELNWWWFFLILAPSFASRIFSDSSWISLVFQLVSIFARFNCYYNITKKFNKDISLAILMTLFPFALIPIIAFSNRFIFDPNIEVWKNGVLTNHENHTTIKKYCLNCGKQVQVSDKFCEHCGKEIQ